MIKFTKRLSKKYYKRVANGLWDNTITPFYARKAQKIAQLFFERQYLRVFRPMVYEAKGKFEFDMEYKKHVDETARQFSDMTGIHVGMFTSYLNTLPKRERKARKHKEKPAPPVRQLRRREFFVIATRAGKVEVEGEIAFEVQGYKFFIHRYNHEWVVSDVIAGKRIAGHERYKKALSTAREIINKHIDQYIAKVTTPINQ